MNTIKIDVSRYVAPGQSAPVDEQYGYWTVTIAEEPISVFSTYSEAETVAKLYAGLYKSSKNTVVLENTHALGQV